MKAVRVHETGGTEKLVYQDIAKPSPGPKQALVRIHACGVNFIDIYDRTGLYPLPLPFTPGSEAAGVVEAVGDGVTAVKAGDRVGYAGPVGSYAEYALIPDWQLVKIPDGIDFQQAAAAMLQGMTAHYLTHSTFPLKRGETVLLHAAAGGVGLLLAQMASKIGARVIGTVGTDEKAALAKQAGVNDIILYREEDFEAAVRKLTSGAGVDVVYDSVGQSTFEKSLNCLKRRGMLVLFGQSSGRVPPFDLNALNSKGSLYVTRPGLPHYAATADELRWRAGDVLQWVADGSLKLRIDRVFKLSEAAKAQTALETRQTAGKVLLIP